MKVLELFSGTHSVGKVCDELGFDVVSLDRDLGDSNGDYISPQHIKKDILTWDYKEFDVGEFDLITASPVCLWWSNLRNSWIGRKSPRIHPTETITREIIEEQIEQFGKPMLDKVIEIIEYFKPQHWWIENPQTGKMKYYIEEKYPQYNKFYDVDYCHYSNWGYKKRTRIWTNIEGFKPKLCHKDCENMIDKTKHKFHIGGMSSINKLEKYRIPEKLIKDLINCIN